MLKVKLDKIVYNSIDDIINGKDIEKDDSATSVENTIGHATSKVVVAENKKRINQIYHVSRALYNYTYANYMVNKHNNTHGKKVRIGREDLIIYYPIHEIASEIVLLCKKDYIYTTFLSTLARQLIEQIILIKECYSLDINIGLLTKAAIASHNKHVGSKEIEFDDLNMNNHGLFKVFKQDIRIGKLARKHKLKWVYDFFSGDIHTPSSIDKLIDNNDNHYHELYLFLIFSVIMTVMDEILKLNPDYDEKMILDKVEIVTIFDQ